MMLSSWLIMHHLLLFTSRTTMEKIADETFADAAYFAVCKARKTKLNIYNMLFN